MTDLTALTDLPTPAAGDFILTWRGVAPYRLNLSRVFFNDGTDYPAFSQNASPEIYQSVRRAGTANGALIFKHNSLGGNYFHGVDDSGGTRFFSTGGISYALSFCTESARAIVFGTNNIARMTIDSVGRVGINTNALTASGLTVVSGEFLRGCSTLPYISFFNVNQTTRYGFIQYTGTDVFHTNEGTGSLIFTTNGVERFRAASNGEFNIGANSHLVTNQSGVTIDPHPAGVSNLIIGHSNGTATNNPYIRFGYNGATIGSIIQSGTTSVSYNTTSDKRLKKNIKNSPASGELIDAIKVRSFDWREADNEHVDFGFVAQELVEHFPGAVKTGDDGKLGQETTDIWAVDPSKLVPLLLRELQDVRARLAKLEG